MGKDSNHGNGLWLVRRVVPSSLIDVSSGFVKEEGKRILSKHVSQPGRGRRTKKKSDEGSQKAAST